MEIGRLDEMAARLAQSKFWADESAVSQPSRDDETLNDSQVPRVRVLYAYEVSKLYATLSSAGTSVTTLVQF